MNGLWERMCQLKLWWLNCERIKHVPANTRPWLTLLFIQETGLLHTLGSPKKETFFFFLRNKSVSSNVATGISPFCFHRYFHRKESLQSDTWSSKRGPPDVVTLATYSARQPHQSRHILCQTSTVHDLSFALDVPSSSSSMLPSLVAFLYFQIPLERVITCSIFLSGT